MKRALTEASLIMKPEGYAEGVLPSLKPSNGDGDFTFTRGSNLSATRVNAEGLIEKGRENLLTYSNDFSNADWVKSNASVTSGQSGYDGTNNAWLLKGNTSNLAHRVYNAVSNTNINTLSVYVKASGHNYIQILSGNSVNQYANFDLSDGSIGNSGSNFTPKIESVGNDWYRISAFNNLSLNYSYIQLVSSKTAVWNESWSMPNATDGVLIQDAQAELGLAATDYIKTGATAAKAGVLENTPRLDYSGGATEPSLLLEPQRTNVVDYSEYLNAHSVALGANGGTMTITDNHTTSPEGLQNAGRIQASIVDTGDTSEFALFRANGVLLLTGDNVVSFYAKSMTGVDQDVLVYWNYTGEIITITNEWQRFEINTNVASNSSLLIGCRGGTGNYYSGGDANLDFALWGLQVEQSVTYPTSYIPTYGTIATRGNDNCSIASTNMFGESKGAFFIEGYVNTLDSGGIIPFTAGIGTSALIYVWIQNTGALYVEWYESGSLQAALDAPGGTINVGDSFKISAAYQDNDFVAYLNGTQIESATSGTAPNPTGLKIGRYTAGAYTGGALDKVILFKERLSNAELAALTKLD